MNTQVIKYPPTPKIIFFKLIRPVDKNVTALHLNHQKYWMEM